MGGEKRSACGTPKGIAAQSRDSRCAAALQRCLTYSERQRLRLDALDAAHVLRELDGKGALGTAVHLAAQHDDALVGIHRDIGPVDVAGVRVGGLTFVVFQPSVMSLPTSWAELFPVAAAPAFALLTTS